VPKTIRSDSVLTFIANADRTDLTRLETAIAERKAELSRSNATLLDTEDHQRPPVVRFTFGAVHKTTILSVDGMSVAILHDKESLPYVLEDLKQHMDLPKDPLALGVIIHPADFYLNDSQCVRELAQDSITVHRSELNVVYGAFRYLDKFWENRRLGIEHLKRFAAATAKKRK